MLSSLRFSSYSILSSQTLTLGERRSAFSSIMAIHLQAHAFAGNPLRTKNPKPVHPISLTSALETLKNLLLGNTVEPFSPDFRILPFRKGKPLATSSASVANSTPVWRLGWIGFSSCKEILGKFGIGLAEGSLVYLGSESSEEGGVVYWAIDVSSAVGDLGLELRDGGFSFVELRTLMVATDWADDRMMGELAIGGHVSGAASCLSIYQAKALLEWHNTSRFCGHCGARTIPIDAGRRKQCIDEACKKRIYPRVDPVVIMLVIDKANDRALLSRQSRFVPRMWSCLAGFIEPGESLEEAVKRETWEETGIEVGEVLYHSSQPWPVGPNSMPCQLMVGFFAYAKSFKIRVDKEELEDAQWHSREDVKKALTFAEYEKAQRTNAVKVDQMCKGVEKGQNLSSDFNVESGELAQMFIPGPFAIAHHLISSWVNQVTPDSIESPSKQSTSTSSL
ncbi:nudix hydrolase 19, chloroplastic isoform X2 [Magnolia sinica]|uniref:nudix hydrolase 19, chloroplastic isoform X2 n=1 Tax=Magnolia sinica TaxID=86752 RepID=UPI0026593FEF|nr:nudix hydrolase 19, chloroplastic isoform X2 [Magnolia sinica]